MSTSTLSVRTQSDYARLERRYARWLAEHEGGTPEAFVLSLRSYTEARRARWALGIEFSEPVVRHVNHLYRTQRTSVRVLTVDEQRRMIEALELIGGVVDLRDAALVSIGLPRTEALEITAGEARGLTPQCARWIEHAGLEGDEKRLAAVRQDGLILRGQTLQKGTYTRRLRRAAILAVIPEPTRVCARSFPPVTVTP